MHRSVLFFLQFDHDCVHIPPKLSTNNFIVYMFVKSNSRIIDESGDIYFGDYHG